MYDFALTQKHYQEYINLFKHFISPHILTSYNFCVKECSLHFEHSGPKVECEYVETHNDGKNSVIFCFYKKKATDKYWLLDIREDILPILKNIPCANDSLKMLLDIHYLYITLTSLTTKFQFFELNERSLFNKGITGLKDIQSCEIIPRFSIDANTMEVVKIDYTCNIDVSSIDDTKEKTCSFYSYTLEYDFKNKLTNLSFSQKDYKTSLISSKIINVKKETFKELEDPEYFENFKISLISHMLENTITLLDIPQDKINLRDLEYLKLLEY